MGQAILNIMLALIWMMLTSEFTFVSFCIGFVLGVTVLFVLSHILKKPFYGIVIWAWGKLIVLFIKELYIANIDILKIVLRRKINTKPGIVALHMELQEDWEKTLLASMISLTPGTMPIAFSDDGKSMYIHCIHVEDKDELVASIKNSFEHAIKEVAR